MELLDRYLQAVKKHLPWQRQDDILAELRANLESQLEDKEAELGRPLTAAEAQEWLRTLGPPIMVASRYQPHQYLIGPALFPIYWYVLRIVLLWATIIYAIVTAVVIPLTTPNAQSVAEAFLRIPLVWFNVATWVTLIFVVFEFVAARYPMKCPPFTDLPGAWNPSTLPPLEKNPYAGGGKPRSFAAAVAEVVFGALALAWLLLIPRHPYLLMGPGIYYLKSSPFHLAHIWWVVYWWIVALNIVQLAWRAIDLALDEWEQQNRIQNFVVKIFGLIPLVVLLSAGHAQYVLLRHPEFDKERLGATLDTMNHSIHLGLMVVCTICVLQILWDLGRFGINAYRKQEAAR